MLTCIYFLVTFLKLALVYAYNYGNISLIIQRTYVHTYNLLNQNPLCSMIIILCENILYLFMPTILDGTIVHSMTDISADTEHSTPFTAHTLPADTEHSTPFTDHTLPCSVVSTESIQFSDILHIPYIMIFSRTLYFGEFSE